MTYRIILSALLAGSAAALLLSTFQVFWVTPLILQAETFEIPSIEDAQVVVETVWQPEDGWQRTLSTIGSNVVMAFGFSLILTGFYNLFQTSKLYQGLAWGIAGYLSFFVSPALGLPPELPGKVAANLVERQYWFLGTVFSTAIGLMLILFPSKWPLKLLGFILLLMPHIIGAPQSEMHKSLVPHTLQTQFIWVASLSNALFWLLLGVLSLLIFRFFSPIQHPAQ